MTATACIIGAAALPVGRYQAPRGADIQTLERELLAGVVMDAPADARPRRRGQINNATLGMIVAELGNYNAGLVHIFEAFR